MPIFGGKKKTRVFFTTDVHGSTVVFKKFINAAKFYEAQVMILGGDMVGKMIVPMVEQAGGHYRANYLGKVYDVTSEDELEKLELNFENSGLYPLRVTPEEVAAIKEDNSLVEKKFAELATATGQLAGWRSPRNACAAPASAVMCSRATTIPTRSMRPFTSRISSRMWIGRSC